jgi:uncharacterized protein YjgD (DUF1641 family)
MEQALTELNAKVDALTAQVAYLAEEARLQQRRRQEWDELKNDMTPVVTELYNLSVRQLDEVESYVQLEDIIRLLKRLMRNTRNLDQLLDQMESFGDLMREVGPIGDEVFLTLMTRLNEMEQKGYFSFLQGGLEMMDQVVTNFSQDDVRQLGENVVLILQTVKEMTQPEVMQLLRSTAAVMREEAVPEDVSMFAIVRQMNDPDVRRGLFRTLNLLKTFSDN